MRLHGNSTPICHIRSEILHVSCCGSNEEPNQEAECCCDSLLLAYCMINHANHFTKGGEKKESTMNDIIRAATRAASAALELRSCLETGDNQINQLLELFFPQLDQNLKLLS